MTSREERQHKDREFVEAGDEIWSRSADRQNPCTRHLLLSGRFHSSAAYI